MKKKKTFCEQHSSWPIVNKDVNVINFKALPSSNLQEEKTIAITEGWRQGDIAAVLRGGANAWATLEVMAMSGIQEVTIIHNEERIPELEDVFFSTVLSPAHGLFEKVTVIWRRERSIFETIGSIGSRYAMLFFGAPLANSELLPFYERIKTQYKGSITIVRGPQKDIEIDEGDEIYRWVRRCTFEADDFALPALLRNYKKKLDKKVAILLPSLNEEKTVANVIKSALEVKDAGIADEVILIDSGSTDRTVEIAKEMGIPVYLHQEIRPDLGSYCGKGEAMFKSAFVTEADIIAWVDTDIETIAPRFFYGLLGPLLTHEQVRFSKGYFSRPVRVHASGMELGGGRVTELLARPWINTFMPELSGYIQPLSGTVAIYKELFLRMRIPVNYGVEMAMLLQVVEIAGLWDTCQVNLGDVVHRSKCIRGLGDMAFQILQVLADMQENRNECNNILRRVYATEESFAMDGKRFRTIWRDFSDGKGA